MEQVLGGEHESMHACIYIYLVLCKIRFVDYLIKSHEAGKFSSVLNFIINNLINKLLIM